MAATLRPGRLSFRISASLPTSTLRSRVCSPGIRIRGIERASPPRRKAATFQAAPPPLTSTPQISGSSSQALRFARLRFLDALAVDELQLVGRRRQAAHADADKVAVLAVGLDPLRDQFLVGQRAFATGRNVGRGRGGRQKTHRGGRGSLRRGGNRGNRGGGSATSTQPPGGRAVGREGSRAGPSGLADISRGA